MIAGLTPLWLANQTESPAIWAASDIDSLNEASFQSALSCVLEGSQRICWVELGRPLDQSFANCCFSYSTSAAMDCLESSEARLALVANSSNDLQRCLQGLHRKSKVMTIPWIICCAIYLRMRYPCLLVSNFDDSRHAQNWTEILRVPLSQLQLEPTLNHCSPFQSALQPVEKELPPWLLYQGLHALTNLGSWKPSNYPCHRHE